MKHPNSKNSLLSPGRCLLALLILLAYGNNSGRADDAPAASDAPPKLLIDATSPDALKQIKPNFGEPIYAIDGKAITVQLPAGKGNYAGIQVYPSGGAATWDLTPYGHVEAKITNTGTTKIAFNLLAKGVAQGQPGGDCEIVGINPGETKVVKTIFGYAFGFHPGALLEPASISQIVLYVGKTTVDQSFRVEELQAAGPAGEKPPFNPDYVVTKPVNGVILGQGATFDPAKQVTGLPVTADSDGALVVKFAGGKVETLKIKPTMGSWNLSDANEIRVKFKNTGDTPATPSVTVGPNTVPTKDPIAPGTEAEVTVSFAPAVTPVDASDWKTGVTPGTGTKFESNKAKEIGISSDSTPGAKNLLVTSIVADRGGGRCPGLGRQKTPGRRRLDPDL